MDVQNLTGGEIWHNLDPTAQTTQLTENSCIEQPTKLQIEGAPWCQVAQDPYMLKYSLHFTYIF